MFNGQILDGSPTIACSFFKRVKRAPVTQQFRGGNSFIIGIKGNVSTVTQLAN